jgi:beta-galactosidase
MSGSGTECLIVLTLGTTLATLCHMSAWPTAVAGLCYGGDYNPEQWPEEVWAEDVALMREAGVNLVSVGIFSWALLEPSAGKYEFDWLDRVLDLLHEGGIAVDLATATASPPPWFSAAYPSSLPVTVDGVRLSPGSRQAYCPSSPEYRAAAVALTEQLATRYADHPALAMWHINNEYGCHVARCYCDVSAEAFRQWLRRRYQSLDALNSAWGTAFWSQRYHGWDEITPPRATPTIHNPTQALDFRRFTSDELLDCYRAERAVLQRLSPDKPATTNFMLAKFDEVDYRVWAAEQDLISNDHYIRVEDPDNHIDLALAADLTRSLAGGAPWLLMEHSTSAVNWAPRNVAKAPGQMRRNSLAHIARGADGAMFFQWRASAAGAEKFHSGMVPHAGTDTKVWREVVQLGADLRALAEVAGSRVTADVAILWDYESWWAQGLDARPTVDLTYLDEIQAWHRTLWRAGITTDLVHPGSDLSGYRVVLAPSLYLVSDASAANLASYAGSLVIGCFSGIVDEHDHVRLGGYPGAFRDLLGVRVEEFFPLLAGDTVRLSDGGTGQIWSELAHTTGAEIIATYVGGVLDGGPAITRNGRAWYVGTRLDGASRASLLARVCAEAGVVPTGTTPGVESVRRRGTDANYLFLINHDDRDHTVAGTGRDLLTGDEQVGAVLVPAGGVVVLRETTALRETGGS